MNVLEFLEKKGEAYSNIDKERMPKIWSEIKESFALPKIIHIVGTNGKGSSGRALATLLKNSGVSVGHNTSPHILSFSERIWMDGRNVDDEILQKAHEALLDILKDRVQELSYFEYATLLAIKVFENCEYAVMEAGLGGEFDATNVFPKILSLFTPIDFDHQAFLGSTIESIASTKLRSMAAVAIIGFQPHQKTLEIAKEIALQKGSTIGFYEEYKEAVDFVSSSSLPPYQIQNISLAIDGFLALGFKTYDINGFFMSGRCQRIAPNVTIDVGHNPLSARALRSYFSEKKINLIYNTFADKDFLTIIKELKPIIKQIFILEVKNSRIADERAIIDAASSIGVYAERFKGLNSNEEYLVYGSFSVIEAFLGWYRCEIDT